MVTKPRETLWPEPSIPRENWTAQDELIGACFFFHFPELGKLTHIHAYQFVFPYDYEAYPTTGRLIPTF